MRELTDEEKKQFRYSVFLTIDVQRTDGAILSNNENAMVQKMKTAAESAIAKVMTDNGHNNYKHMGSVTKNY